jgi:hypothetical protein
MANKKNLSKKEYKLDFIDDHPKKYASPTAGVIPPTPLWRRALTLLFHFVSEVWAAIKTIYKEIE